MVIKYKLVNGRVERQIVHRTRLPKGEAPPDHRHFSQRLLQSYYQLECEQGSRFKSTYSKNTIKRAHETALQRAGVM